MERTAADLAPAVWTVVCVVVALTMTFLPVFV